MEDSSVQDTCFREVTGASKTPSVDLVEVYEQGFYVKQKLN
jgi:hypothetical protein